MHRRAALPCERRGCLRIRRGPARFCRDLRQEDTAPKIFFNYNAVPAHDDAVDICYAFGFAQTDISMLMSFNSPEVTGENLGSCV